MIAEAGHAALWLAAALALLQLAAGALSLRPAGEALAPLVRPTALLGGALAVAAFGALLLVFARTDLSVGLVAANSHSAKPAIYKLSAAWGNHEGSMLLWVAVLGASGAAVAAWERRLDERTLHATLAAIGALALGFLLFLLLASNPFARLSPPALEGRGLNPVLQDPGLAFHPPTLYLGYVGLAVAFAFAVGALVTRTVGPAFARAVRPWVLAAWIFLTLGITAGSWWAYYELGWGGWWFWDPVENASLMPWLAATALLHSVSVLAARGALAAWTIVLALAAFSASMLGTLLVRSGLLTSVHTFAVDPTRGALLLLLLLATVGGAFTLFAARIGTVREGAPFRVVSREGALVANNLGLSAILAIVLVGTIYPLAYEAWSGDRLSVGTPYFAATTGPLALGLVALMGAGPLLRWRGGWLNARTGRLVLLGAAALAVAVLLAVVSSVSQALAIAALVTAIAIGAVSLAPLFGRDLTRAPLTLWGMVVSHLGIAVALAGMGAESLGTVERIVPATPGLAHEVGPWRVRVGDEAPDAGVNYTSVVADLAAQRGPTRVALAPSHRTYADPPTETSEVAISTRWDGQLYAALGRPVGGERQLRLWWKPWITLVWLGGLLVAGGGALALVGRLKRGR